MRAWGEVMLGRTPATVVRTIAWIVLCVLVAQRLTPAALARALPAEQAGRGRARLTRVRRWWTGPPLDQTVVSPQLIQAALTLLPSGQPVVVALDTTRLGSWKVWLAGIVVGGRTMPVGWAVIPYPCGPKAGSGRRPWLFSSGSRRPSRQIQGFHYLLLSDTDKYILDIFSH